LNQIDRPDPRNEVWHLGQGPLRRLVSYGQRVYALREGMEGVWDGRENPLVPASLVAGAVFFTGLLRIPNFNALEPRLGEPSFVRLVGAPMDVGRLCSADTLGRSLRVMDLQTVRAVSVGILGKAERNKVFREGWHGALRYVTLDG